MGLSRRVYGPTTTYIARGVLRNVQAPLAPLGVQYSWRKLRHTLERRTHGRIS